MKLLGLALSHLLLVATVWGQATTATISGVVTDEKGATVAGARVRVKSLETGSEKVAETTLVGRYVVSGLSPGTYEVSVEAPGFKSVIHRVKLAVGDHVTLDVRLEVGEVVERVTIWGEPTRVELERATLSGLVDDKQIRELPLNARSFVHLSFLHTGVMAFTHSDPATIVTRGPQMVVSGLRPTSNAFLLDGVYVNDAGGRTIGSAAGVALGVDAVREFRILTNSYSAEFGMAAAGVVTAVTRSGTNEFHGSAFWFHRNDNLDARNFFDLRKPEFRRHQFGFTTEGPVRRDRTFFFGVGEWFRELKGFTRIVRVPSLAARRGEIVPVAESVRPYLELFPLPNGPDLGGGLAEHRFLQEEGVNETFFQIRVDHLVSGRHTVFGRYTFDDATAIRAAATPNPISVLDQSNRNQYVVLQWDGALSASMLNTLRGGFTRTNLSITTRFLRPIDHQSLSFVPGRVLGTLVIGGIGQYGWDPRTPAFSIRNTYTVTDDLAVTRGAHSLKFGMGLNRFQDNVGVFGWPMGNYDFPSIREFLQGRAERLVVMAAGGIGDRAWRQWVIGVYVQDDWQVRPRLTLNLGVRYEVTTELEEAHGRLSNLRNVLQDAEMTLGDPIMLNPSLRNVAPRFGFAYDLWGDGKTALRGGFGLFFDPLLYHHFYPAFIVAPPFQPIGAIRNPLFPRHPIPDRFPNTGQNIQVGAFRATNPYAMQYNLNLQREVLKDLVVTIGYAGSRGVNLIRGGEVNMRIPQVREGRKFFPAGAPRRNPYWGGIDLKRGDGNSWYNALQFSVDKRFSRGYSLQVAYTFSRTIDEGSAQIFQDVLTSTPDPQDPDERRNERGLSAFHVKHALTVNGIVELPVWRDQKKVVGKVLGGWQLSWIFTARSGLPFTPAVSADRAQALLRRPATVRPDIKPGSSAKRAILGNEGFKRTGRFYDPSIFQLQPVGFLGNAGRNILIGPNLVNVDFALLKNVQIPRLGERGMLQFRVEFYNFLNRANFAPPDRIIFAGTQAEEAPLPSAGRITRTTTDNRQIQVAVKVVF